MYWQRYKEICLKMRSSTPQISMFWSSYGLGTIRFGLGIWINIPKKEKVRNNEREGGGP